MSNTSYITGPQVMARYQISEMTLYRWVNDPKMEFPQPIKINRRRFFLETELIAWERRRAAGRAVA